jgi:hypothetical protein
MFLRRLPFLLEDAPRSASCRTEHVIGAIKYSFKDAGRDFRN